MSLTILRYLQPLLQGQTLYCLRGLMTLLFMEWLEKMKFYKEATKQDHTEKNTLIDTIHERVMLNGGIPN